VLLTSSLFINLCESNIKSRFLKNTNLSTKIFIYPGGYSWSNEILPWRYLLFITIYM